MSKVIIDNPTGTPLTPSPQGELCLGNRDHPQFPCCCDKCDFYLDCFPEYRTDFKGRF